MIQRWLRKTVCWGAWLSILLSSSFAWSQLYEPPAERTEATTEPPLEGQRNVGVLLAIGSYTGFGGGVQLGSPKLGVRASVGWVPLLISLERPDEDPELKLYSGYQLAGDAYVRAVEGKQGANIGVSLGYRYLSLLGSGAALGGYGSFRINETIDGFVQGGLVWFFSGEDHLRKKKADDFPDDVEFGWPGPELNYLISLGILLFP